MDQKQTRNYRRISLTLVPGKLLKRLIRDILVKHMEENNLFSNAQYGFVTGRSCSTQLLELIKELTETLDYNGDVDIIYLDLKKKPLIKYHINAYLKKTLGKLHPKDKTG